MIRRIIRFIAVLSSVFGAIALTATTASATTGSEGSVPDDPVPRLDPTASASIASIQVNDVQPTTKVWEVPSTKLCLDATLSTKSHGMDLATATTKQVPVTAMIMWKARSTEATSAAITVKEKHEPPVEEVPFNVICPNEAGNSRNCTGNWITQHRHRSAAVATGLDEDACNNPEVTSKADYQAASAASTLIGT